MVLQVSRHSVFKGKLRYNLLFSTNILYCLYSDLLWTVLFFFSSFDLRRVIRLILGRRHTVHGVGMGCENGAGQSAVRSRVGRSSRWRWSKLRIFLIAPALKHWNAPLSGNTETVQTLTLKHCPFPHQTLTKPIASIANCTFSRCNLCKCNLGRVRWESIRNKNNWNNVSKRLLGAILIPENLDFHSCYSAPRSRICSQEQNSRNIPNERTRP